MNDPEADLSVDGPDEPTCSYCGRRRSEVAQLVAGPALLVCDRCVERLPERLSPETRRWLRWVNFHGNREHLALPWRLPGGPVTDELVVFQHLPKSGGTTVDFILAAAAGQCGRGYRRFGVSRAFDPPVWMAPGWTGAWESVADFARSPGPHARFEICSGHFPHGVHRLLDRRARSVTLVRDPLAREVSSYNYHHQNGMLDESQSLEVLVSQGLLLDNPQTRMLAGPAAMDGACTEQTYRQALANLDVDFALVGVTERSHGFIGALLGWLGLPAVRYVHSRVTAIRRLETLDAHLASLLRKVHAWDVQLHAHCHERWLAFEQQHRDCVPQQQPEEADILVVSGERRLSQSPAPASPAACRDRPAPNR